MANEQDALLPDENGTTRRTPFDPAKHGLYKSMIRADGRIDDVKWRAASIVGTCRRCGHPMAPGKPVDVNGRTDYEARCTNMAASRIMRGGVWRDVPCDYTINAPDGRTYAGTTRARKRG